MRIILCECCEILGTDTFRDYIKTSSNPSTPTVGHSKCGFIFNFIDGKMPKIYSSKKELKTLAMKFAEKNKWNYEITEIFLLEVDRLKSLGKMSDAEILVNATETISRTYI